MKRAIVSLGAALALASCAKPKPAAEPGAASEKPQSSAPAAGADGKPDFDALAAREATGLTEHRVTGPNKSFTVTVKASAPPKVSVEENVATVEIPIGSGEPMRCQVFGEVIDAGGTVAAVLADASKRVQFQRVAPWAIDVVKEVPTSFVHALYTMQTPRGKALGELKLAVHAPSDTPIVCVHDEFGFEKTFLENSKAFCGSIEHAGGAPPQPAFVDVQIAKIKDAVVGFSKVTVVAEGTKRRYVDTTTLLLPAMANELRVEDNYAIELIDTDLRLESGAWVEGSGGHIDLNVQAKRGKGGSYHYTGEVQGKKIEGDFKAKDTKGLHSALSVAKELSAKARGSNAFSFEAPSYHPGLDPTAPIVSRYYRERGDAPSSVREQLGKMTMTAVLDELGLMQKGEMPIAGVSLSFERAFSRGKP